MLTDFGGVRLYEKVEDWNAIAVYLLKSGEIHTYWFPTNRNNVSIESNKRNRDKNRAILCELKINGCAICGYNKCDNALEFHHVNPADKKFNITIPHIGNKNLVEELNKCILLCANCHRETHNGEVKNVE